MKTAYLNMLLVLTLWVPYQNDANKLPEKPKKVVVPELQILIDSAHVIGSILVYDPQAETYYSNDFEQAAQGHLPASTYKIPHSIIALETGVVEDDSTLFPWKGEKRAMKVWEQDLRFQNAFRYSCVPCYQEVARRIGAKRMNAYLQKLDYGNMKVDVGNIDLFWLEGDSRISQYQQVDFLDRFYRSQLPISRRTEAIVKRMMVMEDHDSYRLSGKTGLSNSHRVYKGWFVGYVETQGKVYFFATHLEPKKTLDMDRFIPIRAEITLRALKKLDIIS